MWCSRESSWPDSTPPPPRHFATVAPCNRSSRSLSNLGRIYRGDGKVDPVIRFSSSNSSLFSSNNQKIGLDFLPASLRSPKLDRLLDWADRLQRNISESGPISRGKSAGSPIGAEKWGQKPKIRPRIAATKGRDGVFRVLSLLTAEKSGGSVAPASPMDPCAVADCNAVGGRIAGQIENSSCVL